MWEPSRRAVRFCRFLLSTSLLVGVSLLPTTALAQDLSSFLSVPPAPGAWARYRVETRDTAAPETPAKIKAFTLAVTGTEMRSGRPFVWVEVSPMDLAGDRDGTLRILIPATPGPEEAVNPFCNLQGAQFRPQTGTPYALTPAVVSMVRSQAAGAKVTQERKPPATEDRSTGHSPSVPCEKVLQRSTSEGSFFFRHRTLVEEGAYWFSAQTPFRLVEADLERIETKDRGAPRRRLVTVRLEEAGVSGARTAFPEAPTKTRGVLSLLFH